MLDNSTHSYEEIIISYHLPFGQVGGGGESYEERVVHILENWQYESLDSTMVQQAFHNKETPSD